MPNGNTTGCESVGSRAIEVSDAGDMVWEFVTPVTNAGPMTQGDVAPVRAPGFANDIHTFRRYAPDYPGLVGRDLTAKGPIERYLLLRNADLSSIDPVVPGLDTIFTGIGDTSLHPIDDAFVVDFAWGEHDDDACASPLVFYQLDTDFYELLAIKAGACRVQLKF